MFRVPSKRREYLNSTLSAPGVRAITSLPEIQHQTELLTLLKSSRIALESQSLQEAFQLIFESCMKMIGAKTGHIILFNTDGTVDETVSSDESPSSDHPVDSFRLIDTHYLHEKLHELGEATHLTDFIHSEWVDLMPEGYVQHDSVLLAPLKLKNKIIGLFGLVDKPGGFTENDVRVLAAFGELVTIIVQQKQAAEATELAYTEYAQILNSTTDAIQVVDTDFNITRINEAFIRLTDIEKAQIVGKKCYQVFPGPLCRTSRCSLTQIFAGEEYIEATIEKDRIEGIPIICIMKATPLRAPDGKLVGIVETFTDIAKHSQVEEELIRESGVNWAMAELAYTIIQSVSIKDISTLVLEYAKRLTDSKFGFIGHINPQSGFLVSPTMTEEVYNVCQVPDKQIIFKQFNGLWGWVLEHKQPLLTNTPLLDPRSTGVPPGHIPIQRFLSVPALIDDRLVGQIALGNSNRNYTDNDLEHIGRLAALYGLAIERKQTEDALQRAKDELEARVEKRTAELRQQITELNRVEMEKANIQAQLFISQKMEALGTLAGGIAHDFNNLLAIICGYSELSMMKVNEPDPLHKHLGRIHRAGMRAADLTKQLLLFSRNQPVKPTALNLNHTIEEFLKMITRIIGEDIIITTDLLPDLKQVEGDVASIEQILMNLVLNARDAMPNGGMLAIRTINATLDAEQCNKYADARPGDFICLSVSDTGIGMEQITINKIFDPFFTTKEAEKGTGLGLSVVYGIVSQHSGWITVSSHPGQGSTFNVYLPTFSGELTVEANDLDTVQTIQGHGERILLIEDEEGVREIAKKVLEDHGYVVFAAATAKAARELFKREKEQFEVVFCDVVLPDENGLQLIDRLLAHKPNLRIVFSSGYAGQKGQQSVIHERGFHFIQKPYSLVDLLQIIREVLDHI